MFLEELPGALDFGAVHREQLHAACVVAETVHHVAPVSVGVEHPRRAGHLQFDLLQQPEPVTPDLRRAASKRVLMMQPAPELVLSHRMGQRVLARGNVAAQRLAEPGKRLERFASRRFHLLGHAWRRRRKMRGRPRDQLPSASQRGKGRVHEDDRWRADGGAGVVQKSGCCLEPLQCRWRKLRWRLAAHHQRMETGEQMVEPEPWLPPVRLLMLESEQQHPHFIQQRGPVDLPGQVVRFQFLYGARE